MEISQAMKIRAAAFAYPRQGEGWPRGDMEVAADQSLQGRNELGRTPEEEAAVAASCQADAAKAALAAQRAAANKSGAIQKAMDGLDDSTDSVTEFVARMGQVDAAVLNGLFQGRFIMSAERKRLITKTRRGAYVPA